jgi:hypothetical protein
MDSIPVIWLNYLEDAPSRGYWDQGMLEDIFSNKMWRTGYEYIHVEAKEIPLEVRGAVIIFPARNQVEFADRLNEGLKNLDWVVLMLTGDEESAFPVEKIEHDNIEIWVMSPRPERHKDYHPLGTGYASHMRAALPPVAPKKRIDWFFSGQITHDRRKALAEKAEQMLIHIPGHGEFNKSEGFTQGLPPETYAYKMAEAKVAPCPSGPETPDSFRLFEALEAGAIPIADAQPPREDFPDDYWNWFFGEEPPFPILRHYDHLQGYVEDMLELYPVKNNQVFAWWQSKKRQMALKVQHQIRTLSGVAPANTVDDQITILMPSSPVLLHPSTKHIEQTIRDVRVQLPNSEIILMLDGVRPEQEHRRADYEEYQRRVLWLCNYVWDNVLPVRFEEFNHQSGMVKKVLPRIATPYVLFVEHDAPLVPDFPIPWENLTEAIRTGSANVIRLHHESAVHPEHTHLMLEDIKEICGAKMQKTVQWSQRPHLSSTAFYRHVMDTYFTDESRAFIEHGLYGPMVEAYNVEGIMGWNLWKVWLYHPDGDNIQRSYDLNSRGKERNYESIF